MTALIARQILRMPTSATVPECLKQWKRDMVQARKLNNEEDCRLLSQVKEALRKIRRCQWPGCGVTLSSAGRKYPQRYCQMHEMARRRHSRIPKVLSA